MTTNLIPVPSTLDTLIGGYRAHVHGRTLPQPVRVSLDSTDGEIQVQPGGGLDLARKIGNLLMWAATLAEVGAEWSHNDADRLLVMVRGRAASGVRFLIYGGGNFADCLGLVPLALGEVDGVSLDELYALAGLLREARHAREVA